MITANLCKHTALGALLDGNIEGACNAARQALEIERAEIDRKLENLSTLKRYHEIVKLQLTADGVNLISAPLTEDEL